MADAMSATVVVATYNRAGMLDGCLAALARQEVPAGVAWEIVVVDNNSTDGTRAVVEGWQPRAPVPVRYAFEPRQGKSHALNAGIAQARGAVVMFTDDDVHAAADWVASAIVGLNRWGAEMLGGPSLPRWEVAPPRWLQTNSDYWGALAINDFAGAQVHTEPYVGPGHIWGSNLACRRSVFDRIGRFDGALGPVGALAYKHEDVDLVRRALAAGLRVVYEPSMRVFHRVPRARMTWRYVCRWYWLFGESQVVQSGAHPGGRHLLGIPGWRCRVAARMLARWAWQASRRAPGAAALQLELMMWLGGLRGYQKLWRLERRAGRRAAGAGQT